MASKSLLHRHVLITGVPGIGKTTLVKGLVGNLRKSGITPVGFYTEELRSVGRDGRVGARIGFDVVDLEGRRCPLARIRDDMRATAEQRKNSVGRYYVDVKLFENAVIPVLNVKKLEPDCNSSKFQVVIVDEIGKMELLSATFSDQIRALFERDDVMVVATIPVQKHKSLKLISELRDRDDVHIIEVTIQNRDACLHKLTEEVKAILA